VKYTEEATPNHTVCEPQSTKRHPVCAIAGVRRRKSSADGAENAELSGPQRASPLALADGQAVRPALSSRSAPHQTIPRLLSFRGWFDG